MIFHLLVLKMNLTFLQAYAYEIVFIFVETIFLGLSNIFKFLILSINFDFSNKSFKAKLTTGLTLTNR